MLRKSFNNIISLSVKTGNQTTLEQKKEITLLSPTMSFRWTLKGPISYTRANLNSVLFSDELEVQELWK